MQKKSDMRWQTAACLSTIITLMYVLPMFFPLYLEMMGSEYMDFISSVPRYAYLFYSAASTFIPTFLLFVFCFQILKEPLTMVKRNIWLMMGTLLIISFFTVLLIFLHSYLFGLKYGSIFSLTMVLGIVFNYISVGVVVLFISYIIYLSEKRQLMALQYETLKTENMQIRYEALKNQLNPHFLFNTMSILDSLVDEDKQRTHEYIQRFSSVYRYILQNRECVTLAEELNFVDNYFGLLKVRYGEALTLKIEIDPIFRSYSIIPLGLQMLLENAVQHNIISCQTPLCITISTTTEHELRVSNNYQPKPMKTSGTGIGLANLAERYQLKWKRDITIEQTTEVFQVTLPLIYESPKTT